MAVGGVKEIDLFIGAVEWGRCLAVSGGILEGNRHYNQRLFTPLEGKVSLLNHYV